MQQFKYLKLLSLAFVLIITMMGGRVLRFFAMTFIILALAGCALQPTLRPVNDPDSTWQAYQQQWSTITTWRAKGQLSIVSDEQAITADYQWQQDQQAYAIKLYGALGLGQVSIAQHAKGEVRYTAADGKTYHAASAKKINARGIRVVSACQRRILLAQRAT